MLVFYEASSVFYQRAGDECDVGCHPWPNVTLHPGGVGPGRLAVSQDTRARNGEQAKISGVSHIDLIWRYY